MNTPPYPSSCRVLRLRHKTVIAALAASCLTSLASAGIIGLKLGVNADGGLQAGYLLPTDYAGAPGFEQMNWMSLGRWGDNAGGQFSVVDSTGADTGVIINWDASGHYSQSGGKTPVDAFYPDGNLMNPYCDSNGGANGALAPTIYGNPNENKPLLYASGLSAWLASQNATSYAVVIYADGDQNQGRTGEYWLQAASGNPTEGLTYGADLTTHAFICDRANFFNTGLYAQVPLASLCNWIPTVAELGGGNAGWGALLGNSPGNYVVFSNLTADSFLLRTEEFRAAGGTLRSPINAVQIVPTTEVSPVTIAPLPGCQVYAGGTATFRAQVGGLVSSYQWRKSGGGNLVDGGNISGSTTPILTIRNVSAADQGNYELVVSNPIAVVTSDPAPLTLVTPAPGSYAEMVATNQPFAYWRLNENADPAADNAPAYDYVGGFNGVYGLAAANGSAGVAGPQPPAFPGFEAGNSALRSAGNTIRSWVVAPPLLMESDTVTLCAWVYPTAPTIPSYTGILFSRTTNNDVCGLGYGPNNTLGYTWNNSSDTYHFASGLVIPSNQWSFVACVIRPDSAALYVYNSTGQHAATNAIPHAPGAFKGLTCIGDDPSSANTPQNRAFTGMIDEVAVFARSLSDQELYLYYKKGLNVGLLPASVVRSPASLALYEGRPARFDVLGAGDLPLSYQWRAQGLDLTDGGRIAGVNTDRLTLADVTFADAGSYDVVLDNVVQIPAVSDAATLTVVASNASPPAYEAALRALNPLAYWRLNETSGTEAFNYWGGHIASHTNEPALGIPGPQPTEFAGFESGNVGVAYDGFANYTDTGVSYLNNRAQFTIVGWFNSAYTQADRTGLFGQNDVAEFGFSGVTAPAVTSDLGIWTPRGTARFTGLGQDIITQGQWYFVAAVADETSLTLYLFGDEGFRKTSTSLSTTNYGASADPFRIGGGGIQDPTGNYFVGQIDEVAVFDRALSSGEISTLYGVGRTGAPLPPTILGHPASKTLYTTRTVTLNVSAVGSDPLTYQWRKNGAALTDTDRISGSTTPTLSLTDLQAPDAGDYDVVVTNPWGDQTSDAATLTVITPPTDSYTAAVLAGNPLAYYRLNEMTDPATGTAVAYDYWGGFNGTYGSACQNGFNGISGPVPPGWSFETDNTAMQATATVADSWVNVAFGSLSTNTVTFTMWVYPIGVQESRAGLLISRGGSNAGGMGYYGDMLSYTWNNNSASTYGFASGLSIPTEQWSFAAMVIEPDKATLYLGTPTGLASAVNAIPHTADVFGTWQIGHDNDQGSATRTFNGRIDEVAVYRRALGEAEIQALFAAGGGTVATPLDIEIAGDKVVLSWSGGTLLEADELTGPWSTNNAASPYSVTPTGAKKFYRLILK